MTDAEQPALFLDTSPRSADGSPRSRTVASDPKRGARLREVHRDQLVWGRIDLGADLTDDDPVRSIWAIVERLELAALYVPIEARDGPSCCSTAATPSTTRSRPRPIRA